MLVQRSVNKGSVKSVRAKVQAVGACDISERSLVPSRSSAIMIFKYPGVMYSVKIMSVVLL